LIVTGGLVAGAFRLAGTQLSQPASAEIHVSVGPRFLRSMSPSPKPKPERTHAGTSQPTGVLTTSEPSPVSPASPGESSNAGENQEPVEHAGRGDD
jgi:hypothetical protein